MMSDMTSQEKLTQARNSVDDIAQIREGRTVSLAKYRNIGIMAHIDAVFVFFLITVVLFKYNLILYLSTCLFLG
jgi:hypothetical protein